LSQEALNQYNDKGIKVSFVLFDEIENASDALWNLLLGILDRATLTLGDNRKVDFSQPLIFQTSDLGASDMNSVLSSILGLATSKRDDFFADKRSLPGLQPPRRKFTPEFMNLIYKMVVFPPFAAERMHPTPDIELVPPQEGIRDVPGPVRSVMRLKGSARRFLIREGTDLKYGARHLKRAIERWLVHPIWTLIRIGSEIRAGDFQGCRVFS
jgi:ATP-dependent Clp protease ATP-binding subunit ClpB